MSRQCVRAIVIRDNQLLVMKRNKFGKEYYTLIGGGINIGENAEQALMRELAEETGLQVANPRLVFQEDGGQLYGVQHIFWTDYVSGEPALAADSEEAKISALGQNTYQPMWLPLDQVGQVNFLSTSVRDALLDGIKKGWPQQPVELTWRHQPEAVHGA